MRVEGEQEWAERLWRETEKKNNVYRLAEVNTNRPRDLVTHTEQSDELFR